MAASYGPPYGSAIYRFNGGNSFKNGSKIFYSDSILLPYSYYVAIGKFDSQFKSSVVVARGKEISLIRHLDSLAHDTTILISDTSSGGITVKNIYTMDITGDGI